MYEKFQDSSTSQCRIRSHGFVTLNPPAMDADPAVLAAVAAAHVPDELYSIIRSIVPPPVLSNVGTLVGDGICGNLSSKVCGGVNGHTPLFTRRPSEESLLSRINTKTRSPKEAKVNLDELYIQLIEPNRYTDEDVIEQLVLQLKEQWPTEPAIQKQALACLVHLCYQSKNFFLSQTTALSVFETMENFQSDEMIQRMGIKLLLNMNLLHRMNRKLDLAFLLLSSLCNIAGVDDFMLYAKNIVSELELTERAQLRERKPYIDMMLNFPYRNNDQITVYLCWCALDTLILLAECNDRWDTILCCDGKARLQRLCLRPELEDRCIMLMEKVFSPTSGQVCALNLVHPVSTEKSEQNNAVADSRNSSRKLVHCFRKMKCGLNQNTINTSDSNGISPLDELITRRLPTPPPTVVDLAEDHAQFSDDETFHPFSPSLPLPFLSPSPSYTPPPSVLKESGMFPSPTSSTGSWSSAICNSKESTTSKLPVNVSGENQLKAEHQPKLPVPPNGSLVPITKCIFCSEPKGKQSLLVKQFKQISHCLQQPCNLLLFKCLESNLCDCHRI